MKLLICILGMFAVLAVEAADLPPDISMGFRHSQLGEDGSISIVKVDKDEFVRYVTENWRMLTDDLEGLPEAEGDFASQNGAKYQPYRVLGAVCEFLPAADYVDFLDKWASLYEKGQIPVDILMNELLGVTMAKRDFVAVNWEDGRIKGILKRVINATPAGSQESDDTLSLCRELLSGKLADNYMIERAEGDALPETLPGVKLREPFGNQIAQIGKYLSRKESGAHRPSPPATGIANEAEGHHFNYWPLALALAVFGIAVFAMRRSWRSNR